MTPSPGQRRRRTRARSAQVVAGLRLNGASTSLLVGWASAIPSLDQVVVSLRRKRRKRAVALHNCCELAFNSDDNQRLPHHRCECHELHHFGRKILRLVRYDA
jgi:hypothetical protein